MFGFKENIAYGTQGFPNDPIFTRLSRLSQERPGSIIHDEYGINASYKDLISDVMHFRQVIREQLPATLFDDKGLLRKEAASIAFLAFSGYHHLVCFFTIVALGGICVPLATTIKEEEALYFLNKTDATCVLSDTGSYDKAVAIQRYAENRAAQKISIVPISRAGPESSPWSRLEIDEELTLPPTTACLVIFTSGTTSLPKGVLLPRQLFYYTEEPTHPASLYLGSSPKHWVGGATGPVSSVLNGEQLHLMKDGSGPARVWEILSEGKVTEMSLSPTLFRGLREYYMDNIRDLPSECRQKYVDGAKCLETAFTSGSVLSPSVRKFFTDLTKVPIINAYGLTEMGGGVMATSAGLEFMNGCIGRPFPGVVVKLSEGDHGEILLKSPSMFIGYIKDKAATHAAFDHEGFYKTGDRAHRVGEDYFFDGRISCDWVKIQEHMVSVLDLEQHLLDLPYVSEAYVLPILDHESGGQLAALIRLPKQERLGESGSINLRMIRGDLTARGLVPYRLPTMLRILHEEEQVPQTASDKVLKKECLRKYFNIFAGSPYQYPAEGVEYWGIKLK
ncbi:hypothetical protein N7537_008247 [Penicillium hordei]|uniref:AMP-dependent synthetase/ligase domain-containing protein n=1 Tax=Penicillium hordei TaxID=40994 RepID=A0AAD6DZZ9_9EURO|nr:uncharacterized protein N7537_008247 [Penicillium hordei]KAJ5598163.1 hypothetical protein N7537_008247 [Penicillium hordei]